MNFNVLTLIVIEETLFDTSLAYPSFIKVAGKQTVTQSTLDP